MTSAGRAHTVHRSSPVALADEQPFARAWRRGLLGCTTLVLLVVATRLPLLIHPGPVDDEVMYSVVANEMVDGGRLYVDAVDRKPPLLFWTYAAIVTLGGKYNWPLLHIAGIGWTLLTMAGLYRIGRELFDRETGLAAAALYSVFQPWGTPKNLALNGEILMNLPLVWAWALVLERAAAGRVLNWLAAGALTASAFLLKQPAAIAAVPIALYSFLPSFRAQYRSSYAGAFARAGLVTAGFFGTLGLVALVLLREGNLVEAVYWTARANDVPFVFWRRGLLHTLAFAAACAPLLYAAGRALRRGCFAARRAERDALVLLLLASVVGTAAGGRFHPHYYIQLVLPLALVAAPAVSGWAEERALVLADRGPWLDALVLRRAVAVMALGFWVAAWVVLAFEPRDTEAGRYLRLHSAPDDRILVWGQSPRIYLDARRRSASRYMTSFALTGYIFGPPTPGVDTSHRIVPGAWDRFAEDMAAHPPAYIVDVRSNPAFQYPIERFPVLHRLVDEHYERVATVAEGLVYRRRTAVP